VLQIRDVCTVSWIPIFLSLIRDLGCRVKNIPDPDPHQRINILTRKKNYLGCSSRIQIRIFLDPGVKIATDPGSESTTLDLQNQYFWFINNFAFATIRANFHTCFVSRVVDPYSFFTDPDPDPELDGGGQYGSGSNTDLGL
jgi:hypothetical protein